MKIIMIYLVVCNLIAFISMYIDKKRAMEKKWRIPEKTLFLLAIMGGSLGSIAGMYTFSHKTRHWYFVVGMPVIFLVQVFLLGKFVMFVLQ